jgi:hypothetical protein
MLRHEVSQVSRPIRLVSAGLTATLLLSAVGTQAMQAATPKAKGLEMRSAPGRMVQYQRGVMDGRTTLVGPERDVLPAGNPRSDFRISYEGTWTTNARTTFESAIAYLEANIASDVPIRVRATFANLPGNTLGSAGPWSYFQNFPGAPVANTWYPVALANKLAGEDLDPGFPDIVAQFDNQQPWEFGTDNVVPANRIGFKSTVLHEMLHGLGFLGFAVVDGTGRGRFQGGRSIYDRFTERGDGKRMTSYPNNSLALGSALRSNDVFFEGPSTTGPRARLYAPRTWEPGSSYSHLDEKTYKRGTINSMMTPVGDFGEGNGIMGPLVERIFDDMGWGEPPDRECQAPGDLNADGNNDIVGLTAAGDLVWAQGASAGQVGKRQVRSAGFAGAAPMVIQDMTGDGCADLVAWTPGNSSITIFPVTGSFAIGTPIPLVDFDDAGNTWTVTGIAAVGDFTDDGDNDLLVRANQTAPSQVNGQLWLLRGNGAGGLSGAVTLLGTGWAAFTEFFSAGDWTNDGVGDLFVRATVNNGTLRLFPGDGLGGLGTGQDRGTGWNVYNQLFGSFDLSGDERPDIVGRDGDGNLWIERSTATGGFRSPSVVIARNWGTIPFID